MIQIPIDIIHLNDDGFHLLVEVFVFGKNYKAVLDTGASKTVFDKTTIKEIFPEKELILSDKLSAGLGTNAMESYMLPLKEFNIADFAVKNHEIVILDLSTIKNAYQELKLEDIIGVIGGDILMYYGALIDYPNRTLSFTQY